MESSQSGSAVVEGVTNQGVTVTVLRSATLVLALALCPTVLDAQANVSRPGTTEVLIVGTFHMANPGRDLANTQVDDVLSPRRQAEIAQVIAALKRFAPTRIAVEAPFYDDALENRYADYAAGKAELSRNEVQQLGFRLAKELGHKTIHSVDADGEFPLLAVEDYARARGYSTQYDALVAEVRDSAKAQSAFLASHTIMDALRRVNSQQRVAWDLGWHFRVAHLGQPWNWPGADLVSSYYRRNMRIYTNIIRVADTPGDRILVIYGSGHLGWLRQIFGNDPTVRVRTLEEFVN